MTLLPVTLSVFDEVTCADFENSLYAFEPIRKEIVSSMYSSNVNTSAGKWILIINIEVNYYL